jgi:hypothetical protein
MNDNRKVIQTETAAINGGLCSILSGLEIYENIWIKDTGTQNEP